MIPSVRRQCRRRRDCHQTGTVAGCELGERLAGAVHTDAEHGVAGTVGMREDSTGREDIDVDPQLDAVVGRQVEAVQIRQCCGFGRVQLQHTILSRVEFVGRAGVVGQLDIVVDTVVVGVVDRRQGVVLLLGDVVQTVRIGVLEVVGRTGVAGVGVVGVEAGQELVEIVQVVSIGVGSCTGCDAAELLLLPEIAHAIGVAVGGQVGEGLRIVAIRGDVLDRRSGGCHHGEEITVEYRRDAGTQQRLGCAVREGRARKVLGPDRPGMIRIGSEEAVVEAVVDMVIGQRGDVCDSKASRLDFRNPERRAVADNDLVDTADKGVGAAAVGNGCVTYVQHLLIVERHTFIAAERLSRFGAVLVHVQGRRARSGHHHNDMHPVIRIMDDAAGHREGVGDAVNIIESEFQETSIQANGIVGGIIGLVNRPQDHAGDRIRRAGAAAICRIDPGLVQQRSGTCGQSALGEGKVGSRIQFQHPVDQRLQWIIDRVRGIEVVDDLGTVEHAVIVAVLVARVRVEALFLDIGQAVAVGVAVEISKRGNERIGASQVLIEVGETVPIAVRSFPGRRLVAPVVALPVVRNGVAIGVRDIVEHRRLSDREIKEIDIRRGAHKGTVVDPVGEPAVKEQCRVEILHLPDSELGRIVHRAPDIVGPVEIAGVVKHTIVKPIVAQQVGRVTGYSRVHVCQDL